MNQNVSQVRCPNCRSPVPATVEQLVDVGHDPGAKARLLSGSLNRLRCPVCGFEGQLAGPLVYHDPAKELLLTYLPVELSLPKPEQERIIGQLINQAINHLPAEKRKAYLLQPQAVLTLQGMVERILQADGITREQIDEQRARLRLLEDLLRTPDEGVEAFVAAHDAELDDTFFQLATLSLQNARDPQTAERAARRLETTLGLTSLGKRLQAQQAEIEAAVQSLDQAGQGLTRERLLDLLIEAPSQERAEALVGLTRPALDYAFFQLLSQKIESAQADERKRLEALRERVLSLTQRIDQAQEARAAQSASVLRTLLQAPDLDEAIRAALPAVDDLFLGILGANLRAARERGDEALLGRLQEVETRLRAIIQESLPLGLQLAQTVLGIEDEAEARAVLEKSAQDIDDDLLGAFLSASQRVEEAGDKEGAERILRLHRAAIGIAMRNRLQSTQSEPPKS
jgi:hypothetical protein